MVWIKRIGLILLAVIGAVLFWGVVVEPRMIDVDREEVMLPGLTGTWEGREVAVVADFQVGMWGGNTATIRRIVRRIVEARPAAVLIAGDFVYAADGRVNELTTSVVELLRPLVDAGIPTFAVLGNHDYSLHMPDDPVNERVAAAVDSSLQALGVHVLENESVRIDHGGGAAGGGPLYIVGIGDVWAGHSDPIAAVADVPAGAPRIVFMHNPESFDDLPAGTAPLAVAAHTHGGQISLPFLPHWTWMSLVNHEPLEPHGWASDEVEPPGNRLYVNIGIGFSDVPVRINATPELTFFRLIPGPVLD